MNKMFNSHWDQSTLKSFDTTMNGISIKIRKRWTANWWNIIVFIMNLIILSHIGNPRS